MAKSLAERKADLIAKRESLATQVRNGNRSVVYDLNLVDRAIQQLNVEMAAAGERAPMTRQIKVYTTKDL